MAARIQYFVSDLIHDHQINLVRLLFGVLFILPFNTFAQQNLTVDDNAGEVLQAPPVEAGPGGDIRLERKYHTRIKSLYEWHTHLFWESRYVTEGRDNLSGENLISASSEFIIDEVSFVPWYGYSSGADYSELNLNFIYGIRPTNDFAVYFGYNHIRARDQDYRASDNEISFDMVYKLLKNTGVFASLYHSFDANGSFLESGVKYNGALSKAVHYSVRGTFGINAEYIPEGHNGLNHVQLRANISYIPVVQVELNAYTGYNQAINRNAIQYADDELLRNFFWGGVGLTYHF
jgi:hypothetical protein